MAMNTDAPTPRDGSPLGFWNRAAQTSPDDLIDDVNKELMELNGGKDIQRSKVRWIYQSDDSQVRKDADAGRKFREV